MKARRVIVILGSIIAVLLLALVVFSAWAHNQEEKEKNRIKTAPARAGRDAKRNNTNPGDDVGAGSSESAPTEPQSAVVEQSESSNAPTV